MTVVVGSSRNDILVGTEQWDLLVGFGGNDILFGGGGADTLDGGDGSDTASYGSLSGLIANLADSSFNTGPAAGDTYFSIENLRGGAFDDTLIGDGGDNVIEGGAGADILIGGNGEDTLSYEHASSGVIANLTDNSSNIGDAAGDIASGFEDLRGSAFDDLLVGTDNTDGTDGNNVIEGGGGADIMIGGNGSDTLNYEHSQAAVVVNLTTNTGSFGDAAGDVFGGFENIRGSAFADVLIGDEGDNVLEGGASVDLLIGHGGNDTASYAQASSGVIANLTDHSSNIGDAAGDVYDSIENLRGSAFGDLLVGTDNTSGTDGANIVEGGAGADIMIGGLGSDTLSYEHSNAGVSVNLTTNTSSLGDAEGDGFGGFENIWGSRFADNLYGDDGDNILDGRAGNDTLTGGAGNDTFLFGAGFGHDTLMDFTVGQDGNELHDGLFADANAALAAAAQTGTDVTITVDASRSIVLHNVALANLHASDFHVV
jgi:Ca2+-binding RTX toxin-like protein